MAWNNTPQSARGWLYILQPDAIFKGRVNLASATYPVHEIPYDGVTTGAYTDIQIGQTVLIGSSDGAWDLGRAYVRDTPDGSVIPIGWASRGGNAGEVTLTDNAYITVLDTYEVWRKPQRLTSAGTLYKDYALAGSTPPSPIMHVGDEGGLGHIGFTDGSVLTLDLLDWSGSTLVNSGETWASRLWNFDDGTAISGSTSTADPVVEFPEGKRWIRLYGEGSDGGETYRRYLVVALNPTTPGTVAFNNLRIRRTADGQTLSADLLEYLDPADYPPGSIVMYLAREKRGSTVTITQRFAGWLDIESSFSEATITHTRRGTTITAVDVAGKLAQLKALPSTVANEASQSSWLEMKGANIERYIHRHLAFETTALTLTDFTLTGLSGSAAYPFLSFSTMGGNMWGVCDGLARAMGRRLTCDSHGRLWLKLDPMRQNVADRTATVQRTITEADWRSLRWQERARPTVGALTVQNVVISSGAASSLLTPFPDVYSIAPGEVAGQGAGEQSQSIGIVQSQTESNERAGHDYARLTAPQGLYNVALAHGVDADIEPADMTWVQITATAGRSGYRGPTLTAESGLAVAVDITVNAQNGVSNQSLTWERETSGQAGARDPRPTAADSYTNDADTLPVREPSRTLTYTLKQGSKTIAAFTNGNELLITTDADTPEAAGGPTWAATDLTAVTNWGGGTLIDFAVDPFSPKYLGTGSTVNGWIMTTTHVQRITDIFGTVALGTAHALPHNSIAGCLRTERGVQNWVIAVQYKAQQGTKCAYTTNGSTWTNVTISSQYDVNYVNNGDSWQPGIHLSPHTAGKAYTSAFTSGTASDGFVTTDYGATWTAISNPNINLNQFSARSISVPYADTSDATVYYGDCTFSTYIGPTLERVTGSGTPTDISPTVGGHAFGPAYNAWWSPRAISISDGNRNVAVLCGMFADVSTAAKEFGVFWTDSAETVTTLTWETLVEPDSTQVYAGAYVVDTGAYLIGTALARWDGSVLHDLTGDMALGSDMIKGICGG